MKRRHYWEYEEINRLLHACKEKAAPIRASHKGAGDSRLARDLAWEYVAGIYKIFIKKIPTIYYVY